MADMSAMMLRHETMRVVQHVRDAMKHVAGYELVDVRRKEHSAQTAAALARAASVAAVNHWQSIISSPKPDPAMFQALGRYAVSRNNEWLEAEQMLSQAERTREDAEHILLQRQVQADQATRSLVGSARQIMRVRGDKQSILNEERALQIWWRCQ